MENNNEIEFEFEDSQLPTVRVETEMFSGDLYELYEMPSELVLGILGAEGPEQMTLMSEAFRLALVNPSDESKLDILSFNELASAMFQWYKKSQLRISKPGSRKTIQEMVAEAVEVGDVIAEVTSMLEEIRKSHASTEEKRDPRFYKPLNDPGDGITPFES